MGCGASANGPASEAQQQEMAAAECHECMVKCAQSVVNNAIEQKTITIAAPTAELEKLKNVSKKLRDKADAEKESLGAVGVDMAEKVASGLGALGSIGKVAGDIASKATTAAGSMAGITTKAGMIALADAVDAPIKKLDEQFSKVAVELLTAKQADVIGAYNAVLTNCSFQNALQTVRGDDYSYVNCPTDRVSTQFMAVCKDDMKTKLSEAVLEEVKKATVVKTWQQVINEVNKCGKALSGDEAPTIELDICNYIVDAVLAELTEEMKKYEKRFREDPSHAGAMRPETFKLVFSADKIRVSHYNAFKEGK